jgi:hypothetical protein
MTQKHKRLNQGDVDRWANKPGWICPIIGRRFRGLEHPQPNVQPNRDGAKADRPRRRQYVLAANLALLAIVVGLVVAITLPEEGLSGLIPHPCPRRRSGRRSQRGQPRRPARRRQPPRRYRPLCLTIR